MRIIGGIHRGTHLAEVGKGDAAAHLRPTSDRVRENLFNILQGGRFGDPIRDKAVLDLFAGTGALGLEALSRGARHVTFVDNGKAAARLIHDNIAKLNRRADTTILKVDARDLNAGNRDARASLVFLDPPYGKGLGAQALEVAREMGWIAEGAVIVWEENTQQVPPPGFLLVDARRYGDTWITFMTMDAWT